MSTKTSALPPVVDADAWQRELDALLVREKAATRELSPDCVYSSAWLTFVLMAMSAFSR